jgi:hypothetical protein
LLAVLMSISPQDIAALLDSQTESLTHSLLRLSMLKVQDLVLLLALLHLVVDLSE